MVVEGYVEEWDEETLHYVAVFPLASEIFVRRGYETDDYYQFQTQGEFINPGVVEYDELISFFYRVRAGKSQSARYWRMEVNDDTGKINNFHVGPAYV